MRLRFYKGLAVFVVSSTMMTLACAQTTITAGATGNYLGMQLGTSNINAQDEILPNNSGQLVLTKPSRKGFGMRLFWGYQFIDYLALEGGYAYFSPATYNIPNGNSPELRIQVFDIVGKGIVPLFWGIHFFGKAGAGIVYYNQAGLLAPNTQPSGNSGTNGFTVRPEFGLGLSYAFTPNWTVDVSATRFTQGSQVPTTSFYAVGLSYHAVDLFCGQFLC